MSVDIELQGMNNLLSRLEELGRKGNVVVNQAIEKGAQPILDEVRSTTLFDDRSGNLRRAQKISKVRTRGKVKYVWVGDVDRECPYAWPLEMGTSKTVARPYMRNAWAKKKKEAQQIIKEELKRGLGL